MGAASGRGARSASRTVPTTSSIWPTRSACARSSPSDTRWAGRSRSSCGAGTARESMVSCSARRPLGSRRRPNRALGFVGLGGLAMASRLTPRAVQRRFIDGMVSRREASGPELWAREQMRRHDLTAVLEASRAVGQFSSTKWIGSIDVPTAVVVTTRDTLVSATTPAGAGLRDRRRDRAPGRRRSRRRRVRGRPLRARAARRLRIGGVAGTGAWLTEADTLYRLRAAVEVIDES